ncbi:hypothetical protein pb186bvf_011894 [Paramecium bursaria]
MPKKQNMCVYISNANQINSFINKVNQILINMIQLASQYCQRKRMWSIVIKLNQTAKYKVRQLPPADGKQIFVGAISNSLQYIIIKPITQQNKLTLLARLSAVDLQRTPSFYTLDVIANYYNLKKILVDYDQIQNIFCVFNTIILSSTPSVITKTQFNQRKQLFRINAYQSNDKRINNISIDYNRSLNIIASGSSDKTIKLWNGNDGSLLMEKQNAYKFQVGDYLINQIIFWDINFQEKQLEKKILIKDQITGLSLVLNQQYIITQFNFIKVYSITGKLIRIFDHEFYPTVRLNGLIQIESMKSVLVEGNSNNSEFIQVNIGLQDRIRLIILNSQRIILNFLKSNFKHSYQKIMKIYECIGKPEIL